MADVIRRNPRTAFRCYEDNTLCHDPNPLGDRPEEAAVLFQDILIGVTSFFRDPETFDALRREVFPRLLNSRARGDPRVGGGGPDRPGPTVRRGGTRIHCRRNDHPDPH